MKLITIILGVSALTATTTAANAASPSDEPVIVRAQPGELPPTRRVSYADLDLATLAGEKTLYSRVSGAVREVCVEANLSIANGVCRRFAWSGAKPQMKQAIARARDIAANGFSTIAPVAISIAAR